MDEDLHMVSAVPASRAFAEYASHRLLPLVRDRFVDVANGGFHERLDAQGHETSYDSKRLMVQCRNLYVLAQAALLGDRTGEPAADAGYAFLRRSYRDETHGGWFFSASAAGEPAVRHKDLYAHAFVLFALAYLHRAFAPADAITLADDTYSVLQERLAAGSDGFWDGASEDWQPNRGLRRQNPHMHLLEAMHSLYAASGETKWLHEANALVRLFQERFFHAPTASLGEFFTADWTPDPERGHIVEPGHHFEWVWLLHRHAALTGKVVDPAAEQLFVTAMQHGIAPGHGGIHDQLDRQGRPLDLTQRIWPAAECIKAHVARFEAGLSGHSRDIETAAERLLDHFIRPAEFIWIERRTHDGSPLQTTLPGSTPYHLFLAAAEVKRVLIPADNRRISEEAQSSSYRLQ